MKLPFLYIILVAFLLVNTAYAEKNVTMALEKDEMIYCNYGKDKSPVAVCNSLIIPNDRKLLIDRFLDFLANGEMERDN